MYDAIIIGGGPGGYLAAERLGQHGRKTLLIEKAHLGGTCLNSGCIPTKSLLNGAKLYVHAKESEQFGITAERVSYDIVKMHAWKQKTVETLRSGVTSMLKKHKVDIVAGNGILLNAGKVKIAETGEVYETKNVLIASGSVSAWPPIPGLKDNPKVVDSAAILSLASVPKKLCVIGGGVIGVEFAGLFAALDTEVSIVEMTDEIIPFMDKDQAPALRKSMQNCTFYLGCAVQKIDGATVYFKTKDGVDGSVSADLILCAAGRRPELNGWGAKEVGIDCTNKGVTVDEYMRTNISGVWAAGDITGKSMLAHSAYRMAEVAVNNIIASLDGKLPVDRMRYNAIPWVVYGLCEAAGAGITEQEAAAKGIAIKSASVPLLVSGRFIAENGVKAPGMVKVIACAKTGSILGIHLLGSYASEIIWGAAALIESEMTIKDVKELIFPHPTVGEAIRDAVWAIK